MIRIQITAPVHPLIHRKANRNRGKYSKIASFLELLRIMQLLIRVQNHDITNMKMFKKVSFEMHWLTTPCPRHWSKAKSKLLATNHRRIKLGPTPQRSRSIERISWVLMVLIKTEDSSPISIRWNLRMRTKRLIVGIRGILKKTTWWTKVKSTPTKRILSLTCQI